MAHYDAVGRGIHSIGLGTFRAFAATALIAALVIWLKRPVKALFDCAVKGIRMLRCRRAQQKTDLAALICMRHGAVLFDLHQSNASSKCTNGAYSQAKWTPTMDHMTKFSVSLLMMVGSIAAADTPFPIPDTMQSTCYDNTAQLVCPNIGAAYYGQDAQYDGTQPSFTDNGDGTVADNVTGLMWVKSPDLNGDGEIRADDKRSFQNAMDQAADFDLAGYDDWRVPTIKEMYSLMDFRGVDPSGYESTDVSGMIPFIDRTYFDFAYGDTAAGERIIDSQMVSSNRYVGETPDSEGGYLFGVNFADGRIKGYGMNFRGRDKTFFVMYVRGAEGYGINDFTDNGDGTITDATTGLMWTQPDSGEAMDWSTALAWAQDKNAEAYLGYADWRLPNVKELQAIVDYARSPDTTGTPALDPVFERTGITNEAGEADFGFYWSATTHANWTDKPGEFGAYVSFGHAMGYFFDEWQDVHGAGAQRSDPKTGDPSAYPEGNGPQGDAIRIYNFVRLVRQAG
jgi:hypothetical protein